MYPVSKWGSINKHNDKICKSLYDKCAGGGGYDEKKVCKETVPINCFADTEGDGVCVGKGSTYNDALRDPGYGSGGLCDGGCSPCDGVCTDATRKGRNLQCRN